MKVFIVEDSPVITNLYQILFNYHNIKIIDIAMNGKDAVQIYDNFIEKPDIILMDYHLPAKSGLETSKEILDIDKNAKIIIVSGDKSISKKALAIGVDFQEKPFNIKNLLDKMGFKQEIKI